MPKFDWLWCVADISIRLARSPLLQKEAKLMWTQQQIESLEEDLQEETEAESIQTELCCLHSHEQKLEAEIQGELDGAEEDARLTALQLLALINLALVAYWGNPGADHQVLDWILGSFSCLFSIELCHKVWSKGLWNKTNPEMDSSSLMSSIVISLSLFGTLVLAIDQDHSVLGVRGARCLSSMTVLLLITWNKQFSSIFLTFARAATTCLPVISLVFFIISFFALASRDIFGDEVLDSYSGYPYFDTYDHSISTLFRMLLGLWHGVMYQAVGATTEAAQLWFTLYALLAVLICMDLFVGVVMTQFDEVNSFISTRLFPGEYCL